MNVMDGMEGGLDAGVGRRAIRAFMAIGRRRGWRGRSHSFGSYEARGRHPSRPASNVFCLGNWCQRATKGTWRGIFGPSQVFTVPAIIIEDEIVSPTGTDVDVMVIDCSIDVVKHMRAFTYQEELVYNYDEDSPYALPSMDALLPKIKTWVSQAMDMRVGFYTPEEAEGAEETPATPRRRKPPAKATPLGGGAKPKRPTTATLATEMRGILDALPQITKQLTVMSERQTLLESRLAVVPTAKSVCSRFRISLEYLLAWPTTSCVRPGQEFAATSQDSRESEPWFVGFPWNCQAVGSRGACRREAGGLERVFLEFRRCIGPSSFGPEQSFDIACGSNRKLAERPPVGAHRLFIDSGDQRSCNEIQASIGVGPAQRFVFSRVSCRA